MKVSPVLGRWVDGGGHDVTIRALQTKGAQLAVLVENVNPEWSGRGQVEADGSLAIGFENGVSLSGRISSGGDELQWQGGHIWKRSAVEVASVATLADEPQSPQQQQEKNASLQSQPRQQEAAADAVAALKHELRLVHSCLDRSLLLAFIFVGFSVLMRCLPEAAMYFTHMLGLSLTSGIAVAWVGGVVSIDSVLIVLTNIFVIAPFNVAAVVLYYVTWPLQQPIWRWVQWKLISLISNPPQPVPVSYWDATFVKFLDILPGAFKLLLPLENIDNNTQAEVRAALDDAWWLKLMGAAVKKNVPAGLLNSLALRMLSQMVMVPTLGWWWLHVIWLGFLPLSSGTGKAETAGGAADDQRATLPPVVLRIPHCYILGAWRKAYGEDLARQKCQNE